MKVLPPSEHSPMGPLHKYLGHFTKPEYHNAGHNDIPLPKMGQADWAEYYDTAAPEYSQKIKDQMSQSEKEKYDKTKADKLWKMIKQKRGVKDE